MTTGNPLRRFVTWYVLGYVALILVTAWLFARGQHDRDRLHRTDVVLRNEIRRSVAFDERRAYELCLKGNEFRRELVASQKQETEDLIAASNADRTPSPDPAEEAAYRRRIDSYRARRAASLAKLGPRDCGASPRPVPAP